MSHAGQSTFRPFFSIDGNSLTYEGLPVFELSISPSMSQSSCAFCKLFAPIAFPWDINLLQQKNLAKQPFHLRAYTSSKFWSTAARNKQREWDPFIVLGIHDWCLTRNTHRSSRRDLMDRGVIQPQDQRRAYALYRKTFVTPKSVS